MQFRLYTFTGRGHLVSRARERLFSQGNVWILPLFLSEDVSRKVGCLLRLVLEKGLLSGPSICSVDQ